MEHITSTSSAEELSVQVINTAVQDAEKNGALSTSEFATHVEKMSAASGMETPETARYISALRNVSHDATVGALPEGIGGQFDGEVTIATSTLEVGSEGIEKTIAQMQEVDRHEAYHALNQHLEPLQTVDGSGMVVIAGEEFSTTEVIEGLTVSETGNVFVSDGYRQHEDEVTSAIAEAGLSRDDLRRAVNDEKDLTQIDDRARQQKQFAMAA